jgi:peptidoglycan/xylan/chitin deacetylase (PgdA/CDA1 family)
MRGRIWVGMVVCACALAVVPMAGADTVTCRGKPVTILGTHGDDRIRGTPRDDVIHGRAGNDLILGFGGNDLLCGGSGDDLLFGGDGRDVLVGNDGADRLDGGLMRDRILGNRGDDVLLGQEGPDRMIGGADHDILNGGAGADFIAGSTGDDTLRGERGRDRLQGNGGDDVLVGGRGDDTLVGGSGDDRCSGNNGIDGAQECEQVADTEFGQVPEPRVRPRPGTVALTFDDGPSPATTPAVLDVLDRYGVKATFFVIGRSAAAHPDLIREIARRGHSIQNHTWSHPWLTRHSDATIEAQLVEGAAAIEVITGRPPACWRPPYMAINTRVQDVADRLGYRTILWDVDPFDWRRPGSSVVANHVLRHTRDGDIVLFHDTTGPSTTSALPAIIEGLRARGLGFDTLCN